MEASEIEVIEGEFNLMLFIKTSEPFKEIAQLGFGLLITLQSDEFHPTVGASSKHYARKTFSC